METPKEKRTPGPRRRLKSPEKFSTQITARHRQMLEAYVLANDTTIADATRKAIELLVESSPVPITIPE